MFFTPNTRALFWFGFHLALQNLQSNQREIILWAIIQMKWKRLNPAFHFVESQPTGWLYSEPSQVSKICLLAIIVNVFQPITISVKRSILDVWQCFECTSIVLTFSLNRDNFTKISCQFSCIHRIKNAIWILCRYGEKVIWTESVLTQSKETKISVFILSLQ